MQIPVWLSETKWDYRLMDTGDGQRLEAWAEHILIRPEPTALWTPWLDRKIWQQADAKHSQTWDKNHMTWAIHHPLVDLVAKLAPFKHTGIFPEQAANWEWLAQTSNSIGRPLRILHLFAYTGAATCVLAKLGHQVTHVDASKPTLAWAKENFRANNLAEDAVRIIPDDVRKFVARELKRDQFYDGIVLDPPVFGHGPSGQTWKLKEDLGKLLSACFQLCDPKKPGFLLLNSYAGGLSALTISNILTDLVKQANFRKTEVQTGELCLSDESKRLLSTGVTGRVTW